MTVSKLNREWDPFTLAEGIANRDFNDKAGKSITHTKYGAIAEKVS